MGGSSSLNMAIQIRKMGQQLRKDMRGPVYRRCTVPRLIWPAVAPEFFRLHHILRS